MKSYIDGTVGITTKAKRECLPDVLNDLFVLEQVTQRTGLSKWEQLVLLELYNWEEQGGERMPAVELFESLSQETDAEVILDMLERKGLIHLYRD